MAPTSWTLSKERALAVQSGPSLALTVCHAGISYERYSRGANVQRHSRSDLATPPSRTGENQFPLTTCSPE